MKSSIRLGVITLPIAIVIAFAAVAPTPADHNTPAALAARVAAVGQLNIVANNTNDANNANNGDRDTAAPAGETDGATDGESDGELIYQTNCLACHATGVAGAPVVGTAADWVTRLGQGFETLLAHALQGFTGETGVMPARGGNANLTDAEVAAAIRYMTEQSQ